MKKRAIIALFAAAILSGCTGEPALAPTKVKNWYVIEYREGMDEVDQKIYDIYRKYGVAVFYDQLIGTEDTGRVDEDGNPIIHNEKLDPSYDMSLDNASNKVEWKPFDYGTPEKKARMMPLLRLLDDKLLAMFDGVEVNIAAIFIVNSITVASPVDGCPPESRLAHRGFRMITLSMAGVNSNGAVNTRGYGNNFFTDVIMFAKQSELKEFYNPVKDAMAPYSHIQEFAKDTPEGLPYGYFEPVHMYPEEIGKYRDEIEKGRGRIAETEEIIAGASLTPAEIEALEAEETRLGKEYMPLSDQYFDNELRIYELGEELKNPGLPAETAEQYRREIDELTALNRLINRQMREIEVELSRIDNLLSGAELTPSQVTAYKAAIAAIENGIAEMEDEIAKMEAVFPTYGSELPAECRWEKYGWLGLSPHDIRNCPSKHDDLQMYLEELIYNDESKFKRQYADWPVILKRYTYLRAILAAEGYDFFKIRLLLTSQ